MTNLSSIYPLPVWGLGICHALRRWSYYLFNRVISVTCLSAPSVCHYQPRTGNCIGKAIRLLGRLALRRVGPLQYNYHAVYKGTDSHPVWGSNGMSPPRLVRP